MEQSGFIRGEYMNGPAHPPWVTITSFGIDTVDNVTNQIISDVSMDGNHESVQEIITISDEPHPKKKIVRFWEYAKANPAFFSNIIEKIFRISLGGAG